jgi:hypothetical protein
MSSMTGVNRLRDSIKASPFINSEKEVEKYFNRSLVVIISSNKNPEVRNLFVSGYKLSDFRLSKSKEKDHSWDFSLGRVTITLSYKDSLSIFKRDPDGYSIKIK